MSKKDRELVPTQGTLQTDKDYQDLLRELQSLLAKGQYTAYKAVDNIKVQTYWQSGKLIVREELKQQNRADYGKHLVESLAVDLKINRRDLYRIIKFYRSYPIVGTVSPQLSWGHYYCLVDIEEDNKRLFYQNKAVLNSWGVRDLKGKNQEPALRKHIHPRN